MTLITLNRLLRVNKTNYFSLLSHTFFVVATHHYSTVSQAHYRTSILTAKPDYNDIQHDLKVSQRAPYVVTECLVLVYLLFISRAKL